MASSFVMINRISLITHIQYVTISFVRIISTGHKRPLEDKDLWALNKNSRASYIVPKVKSIWNYEQIKCNRYVKYIVIWHGGLKVNPDWRFISSKTKNGQVGLVLAP